MASIYVHIPFCQSRCIYCDFFSTTHIAEQQLYVECLEKELLQRRNEWPQHARTLSIYIGGGTPSTLPTPLLEHIFRTITQHYPVDTDAEVTLEANPDDVTPAWIEALRRTPVNRISMGVQTFNDDELQFLRRRHSSRQAIEAVRLLQQAGYRNLSIDLIYGLPGQTIEQWERNVDAALSLNIPHISAYSLMYEEGTPLTRMLDQGLISEMDDEMSWQCYVLLCRKLRKAGYEHYEISNFAKPGMHSRHNSAYWTGEAYLGFGAGAHSYDGGTQRRGNIDSLQTYTSALKEIPASGMDDLCGSYYEVETLSPTDLYNEYVMTRLRTSRGFPLHELEQRFGTDAATHCTEMAQPHLQSGHLMIEEAHLRLTEQGIFVSNDVISDLFL